MDAPTATHAAGARAMAPSGDAGATRANDGGLLERMSAGDEQALGALYDRWSSAVYALALRIAGDRDEADDVVEETFWQAWRQAARYEGGRGSVSTWLLTIARSRAVDRIRAVRRRREEQLVAAPAEVADAPPAEI